MICGGPKTGKTTLARKLMATTKATGFISTDDFLSVPREDRPFVLAEKLKQEMEYGPLTIVEGCEAPRLLDRLSLLDLPPPWRVVWVGPRKPPIYEPRFRGLVAAQERKIIGAKEIGLLTEHNPLTDKGNLIYVSSQVPER